MEIYVPILKNTIVLGIIIISWMNLGHLRLHLFK